MALNSRPLRDITQQDIDDYQRDGVVCLRQVLSRDWVDLLEPIAREVIIGKQDVGLLPTIPGRYMARRIAEYRRLVFESPIAEAAGKVMQSREIRFFFDEFFAKPPQSDAKTLWHCDRMGIIQPAIPLMIGASPFPNACLATISAGRRVLIASTWPASALTRCWSAKSRKARYSRCCGATTAAATATPNNRADFPPPGPSAKCRASTNMPSSRNWKARKRPARCRRVTVRP